MQDEPKERGIWAEHYVRDFLSLPFISEFVFHSLQTIDGTQKEVADFLIAYPGVGVLMSQKTQKDPLARDAGKTVSWGIEGVKKSGFAITRRAANGARQIHLVRTPAAGQGGIGTWPSGH